MFRCKSMAVEEWAPFQNRFEEFFMAVGGDSRIALFIEADNDDAPVELDTLLIPSHRAELVEALSPGGWADCPDAKQRCWGLLVGHASAVEDHGLKFSEM